MANRFIEVIKKKWLRNITLTILLFAIIICVYLGINYAVSLANISDLDFTAEKIYSISQTTKDKLQDLEEDVTISIYNMYDYVNDFAYKYANLNEHIKVEELENLNAKSDWKTNYGVTDTSSFMVIHTDVKEKILYDYNLYTYDYTTYEEIDITEESMTNAIIDVTTEVKPKIYFATGHELYSEEYFQLLEASLISEVNEVEYVDLLTTSQVPEDCEVLVLTALKEDITEAERDDILDYIENGGEILLLLDPNLNQIETPNFQEVLDEYGVSVSDGIILEGDSSKMMYSSPSYVISTINSSSEIVKNISMDLNICMMNPGKLTIASDEELEEKNVTSEILAAVSEQAFYRTDLEETSASQVDSDEDAAGATVAAMFTKEVGDDNNSKMIVFANTVFATNMSIQIDIQYYSYAIMLYNNEDVLLNSISYLTENESNITIRKTGETVTTYNVTAQQTRIVLAIIFAIPIFIIILGIIIWQVRRRKK